MGDRSSGDGQGSEIKERTPGSARCPARLKFDRPKAYFRTFRVSKTQNGATVYRMEERSLGNTAQGAGNTA